ncbi:septation protein A [Stutzerimonas azotifigens]|uniref:septation protein A n=1 Tax=Stutzerimonas azotifigens TaxID=291995 RepID=UPI00280AEBF4|nr:septation protein A [Stutzerimonas azotifigens]
MKQFLEFIPLLLFFLVYKLEPRTLELAGHTLSVGGIYSATAVLIISSLVLSAALLFRYRKLEKGQWIALLASLLFGGLTLALHSETFLKWKAPVVNWIFAAAFAASHFIGERPIIQRIMGHTISLPAEQWARLNIAWVLFFLVCGFSNLFVAFAYPAIWVDFKVFGSLGMTLLFMIGQGLYLYRYLQEPEPKDLKE